MSRFELTLPFAGETCSACGAVTAPGACSACGAPVAETSADALARGRRSALGECAEAAAALCARLRDLPPGHVRVAADQFAECLVDVGVFGELRALADVGSRLAAFDFDDSKVVGAKLRRASEQEVATAGRLVQMVEEFAVFDPPPELADARAVIVHAALHGVEIVETVLRAATTTRIAELSAVQRELDHLMEAPPWPERLRDAEARVRDWGTPDPDARIARGLGISGRFTDSLGLVDLDRVVAGFAQREDPFGELGRTSARYLRHLLTTPPEEVGAGAAGLIVPALMMCSLDRPLGAHRVAVETSSLLRRAFRMSGPAVEEAIASYVAELPRTLESARRVRYDVRYLHAGLAVEDADAAARVVTTYKRLAETGFRAAGALAVDAHRIARGELVEARASPPTVGALEHDLVALDRLGELLLAGSDAGLRNAEGHEQYALTRDGEGIIDQRTGVTWDLGRLERLIDDIVAAIVGVDAALGALIIDEDLDIEIGSVIASADGSFAEQLVSFLLAGQGMSLVALDASAGRVTFDSPQRVTQDRAAHVLFALASMFDTPTVRLERTGTGSAVEAARERLVFGSSQPEVHDLVYLQARHEIERRRREPSDALATYLWQQLKVIAATGLDALDAADDDAAAARTVANRLVFMLAWAETESSEAGAECSETVDMAREVVRRASGAAHGDPQELARLRMRLWRIHEAE